LPADTYAAATTAGEDRLGRSLPDARDILDELQKARHSASSTDLRRLSQVKLRVKANLP
jgi:hypothetical protein